MHVEDFVFGIEIEGYWKGKAGSGLPGHKVDLKGFAEALVSRYNHKIGLDMLRAEFSYSSHPGHHEDFGKWTVAPDDAIGYLDLNSESSELDGSTYSTTLCSFTVSTGLTTIQVPLSLSLPN